MILFIDDEPQYILSFVQAFELSKFEVKISSSVDEAAEFIKDNQKDLDAIILDVMMPTGRFVNHEESQDGLRTGLIFLNWLKKFNERIPVILLTNVNKRNFKNVTHKNCIIFEKKDIDPWQLVDKMYDVKRRPKLDD
jgi:CheY-like chemotaxis protein